MNWDQVEGKWQQVRGRVRQSFAKLTDDDVAQLNGRREELVGKLQERYGYAKEEAERHADRFVQDL